MNLNISGKIAVVTGSSTGLGKAVAYALAAEGVKVALFARSVDKLQAIAADIQEKHGVCALAVGGDMRRHEDVDRLVAEVRKTFGGVDILVVNSGRPPQPMHNAIEEDDDARWEDAYQTQLWGPVIVARKIVPLIVQRGWGRVIAITSASVKQPMPHHALSTIFRAGVTGYMKHLANEVAGKGITVNTVCPGLIDTVYRRPEVIAERLKRVPVNRLGRADEFAAAVAFLASEQAGYITGASLQVDGGWTASLI